MQLQHQKITLDVNDTRAFTVLNAHQGDSKTRFIDITLTENGNTITLSSSYVATVKASINNKTKAVNTAVVNTTNNVITVELTKIMLDTPGLLNCEVILQEGQQFVTSATFTVKVAESVISDESAIVASQEFGKLLDALIEIKDIEDKADRVQTLVDNIDKLESADRLKHLAEHGRFNFSATFTSDGVIKKTTSASILQAGDFATGQNDIGTAYVSNAVTKIGSGTFSNCTSLTTIYVDNTVGNVEIVSGAIPDGVSIVYSNDDNFINVNELLASAIKSLKSSVNSKVDTTDFNAYKSATDTDISKCVSDIANNSALISKSQINVTTDKSTSIVLNDSSDCNIVGLNLYGNSIQSAVPTPTAPVNIDNVTNPQIKLYRKNLFDFSVCNINVNDSATINSADRDNCTINFTTSEAGTNSGIYLLHVNLNKYNKGYGVDYTKLNGKSVTLSFDIQSSVDCKMSVQFTRSSYTSVNISSTKQRFSVTEVVDMSKLSKAICFYLNNVEATVTISNIQIEVCSIATDYEKCNVNQVSADCTLCKVNNIADTLTVNVDGTGYITQNLLYERLTSGKSQSGHSWKYSTTSKRFYRDDTRYKANAGTPNLICSHFEAKDNERDITLDNSIGFTSGKSQGVAIRMLQFDGDISAFENWLDNNEVYILIPLKQPIVTELSKEQVDKILSLYTYYPSTTVISDSDFVLTYVADTKNYIDNKFNELATAIVAHESEVN